MKENIFDVLIYLFENYLDDDEITLNSDSNDIKTELLQAGFEVNEVNNAFDWLETLAQKSTIKPGLTADFRIFSAQEEIKLDLDCRNLLIFLQNSTILTRTTREIVIDRLMAVENKTISLDELKWTVLMVLLNQSDDDLAFSRMEDIVYDLTPALLH